MPKPTPCPGLPCPGMVRERSSRFLEAKKQAAVHYKRQKVNKGGVCTTAWDTRYLEPLQAEDLQTFKH